MFNSESQQAYMQKQAASLGLEKSPKQPSAAEQIGEQLEHLATFASEIAAMTGAKLSSVMREDNANERKSNYDETTMPPYFAHLRSGIQAIEYQLKQILDFIKRTDI